jgi:very-short-patch-repair endonuclease
MGVPATSVERTLLDIAAAVSEGALEVALDWALRNGYTTMNRLRGFLDETARRGRRGAAPLRRVLAQRSDWTATDSALETKTLRLCRKGKLPQPQLQRALGAEGVFIGRVDLIFRDARLVIEVDSYRYHSGCLAWQNDLSRQNKLICEGYCVLRFTEDDIDYRPDEVIATIRRFFEGSGSDNAP